MNERRRVLESIAEALDSTLSRAFVAWREALSEEELEDFERSGDVPARYVFWPEDFTALETERAAHVADLADKLRKARGGRARLSILTDVRAALEALGLDDEAVRSVLAELV